MTTSGRGAVPRWRLFGLLRCRLDVVMIRTGYLRWEIEVQDVRSRDDPPVARGDFPGPAELPDRSGQDARAMPTRRSGSSAARRPMTRSCEPSTATAARPTCGFPTSGRGRSATPRATGRRMPRYWMEKLQREAEAFAHEVVRTAASFPQLVISSPAPAGRLRPARRLGDLPGHRGQEQAAADRRG